MANLEKSAPVTNQELLVSRLAQTDALAKLSRHVQADTTLTDIEQAPCDCSHVMGTYGKDVLAVANGERPRMRLEPI